MSRLKSDKDFITGYILKTPALLLMKIDKQSQFGSKLSRTANMTLSTINKALKILVKCKLVKKTKDGRINILTLTAKGMKLQELLLKMKEESNMRKKTKTGCKD